MRRPPRFLNALMMALTAAALAEQLRRPPEERTWHGRIAGVPYDFRPPTPDRVRSALWNKNNPSVLVPTVFGLGWTLNFYRLLHPSES